MTDDSGEPQGTEGTVVPPDTPEPIVPKDIKPKVDSKSKKKKKVEETVSKKDYMSLQKQIMDLQKEKQQSEADNEELERTYAFNELKNLNPQLAKINKDSSAETLKTVISTITEIKKDFPSLKDDKKGADLTPKIEGIVGFKDPNTGKWVDNNPNYL